MTTRSSKAQRGRSHWLGLIVVAAATLLAEAASAQLSTDERKCQKLVVNRTRLIANHEQKKTLACVKNGVGDINACVNTPATKAARHAAKLGAYYLPGGFCDPLPPFGVHAFVDRIAGTVADGAGDIARGIFGDPVDDVLDIKCHQKLANHAGKKYYAILSRFYSCINAIDSLTGLAQLEACIVSALEAESVLDRQSALDADVNERCADDYGIPPNGTGDGLCAGATTSAEYAACVGAVVNCEACQTINATVDTAADCELLDDGLANGSCPADALHVCTFGHNDPTVFEFSALTIWFADSYWSLNVSGSSIDIGGAGSMARCAVRHFDPIVIPGLGTLCVRPGAACPDGSRWCGPGAGPALGVGVFSDADVGACTSTPDCAATCASACPLQYGVGVVASAASCTGRCNGGSGSTICSTDADCAALGEGSCGGKDTISPSQRDICQCTCTQTDGLGSSATGDMQCNLAARLSFESSPPCDGTDVYSDLGDTCIPFSTQAGRSYVNDANFTSGSDVPSLTNEHPGTSLTCDTVDNSTLLGLTVVGTTTALGTALGDVAMRLIASCTGICGDGNLDPGEICEVGANGPCLNGCTPTCTCVPQDCGASTGEFCWFLGAPGASCAATCSANGRIYDTATETFAGSDGSDANCGAVLADLGDAASFLGAQNCAVLGQTGTGCRTNGSFSSRCTAPPTTLDATNPGSSRVCVCE